MKEERKFEHEMTIEEQLEWQRNNQEVFQRQLSEVQRLRGVY